MTTMDCSLPGAGSADDVDLEFELPQLQRCRPPDTSASVAPTELQLSSSSFSSPCSSTCDSMSSNPHLPLPAHFVDSASAPSSSSSSSSPNLSPMSSPPSSPEPHHQQQHQLAAAETSSTCRVCYFTHTLRANTDLSWTTVHTSTKTMKKTVKMTYKVAFDCPNDTFAGRVFGAELVATSGADRWDGGGGEMVGTIDLGVMKVVSTTSVRKRHHAQLEQLSPSRAHQRLVANFKRHHARDKGTASRRHHANGKGVRQLSRRGLPFLLDEYRQAVELAIARNAP